MQLLHHEQMTAGIATYHKTQLFTKLNDLKTEALSSLYLYFPLSYTNELGSATGRPCGQA
jgi:hypothetical protein